MKQTNKFQLLNRKAKMDQSDNFIMSDDLGVSIQNLQVVKNKLFKYKEQCKDASQKGMLSALESLLAPVLPMSQKDDFLVSPFDLMKLSNYLFEMFKNQTEESKVSEKSLPRP